MFYLSAKRAEVSQGRDLKYRNLGLLCGQLARPLRAERFNVLSPLKRHEDVDVLKPAMI